MTGSNHLWRFALRYSGGVLFLIAFGHFLLPTLGYDGSDIDVIPIRQRDHFVYLGTYAIGSFLLAFALACFDFSRRSVTTATRNFALVMVLVWSFRLVLEFLYPVNLPIMMLSNPHPVLGFVIASLVCAFGITYVSSHKTLQN